MLIIREFQLHDVAAILQLFYDTVHTINIRDYTEQQVNAWASPNLDQQLWIERLSQSYTYVAEDNQTIVGFANLTSTGYLDCLYCHKDWQGRGVGSALLRSIELKAHILKLQQLTTAASITAKPFFLARGFTLIKEQQVERRGETFKNFLMFKELIRDRLEVYD